MSKSVLADAQFSIARVFRPFLDFEPIYSGQSGEYPIAFPGTLDREASKPGFDPTLISGIPMPFGSKVVLWIPNVLRIQQGGGLIIVPYEYTLVWRMRNVRDFRSTRSAYHFPRQSLGENSQFVIPAAIQGLLYEGPVEVRDAGSESDFSTTTVGVHQYVHERITFESTVSVPPLTPGGVKGAFQQGLEGTFVGSNQAVTFNQYQLDCMGDELIILVNKSDTTAPWNFSNAPGSDRGFSVTYGTDNGARLPIRDMGIYIFTGSNP